MRGDGGAVGDDVVHRQPTALRFCRASAYSSSEGSSCAHHDMVDAVSRSWFALSIVSLRSKSGVRLQNPILLNIVAFCAAHGEEAAAPPDRRFDRASGAAHEDEYGVPCHRANRPPDIVPARHSFFMVAADEGKREGHVPASPAFHRRGCRQTTRRRSLPMMTVSSFVIPACSLGSIPAGSAGSFRGYLRSHRSCEFPPS